MLKPIPLPTPRPRPWTYVFMLVWGGSLALACWLFLM